MNLILLAAILSCILFITSPISADTLLPPSIRGSNPVRRMLKFLRFKSSNDEGGTEVGKLYDYPNDQDHESRRPFNLSGTSWSDAEDYVFKRRRHTGLRCRGKRHNLKEFRNRDYQTSDKDRNFKIGHQKSNIFTRLKRFLNSWTSHDGMSTNHNATSTYILDYLSADDEDDHDVTKSYPRKLMEVTRLKRGHKPPKTAIEKIGKSIVVKRNNKYKEAKASLYDQYGPKINHRKLVVTLATSVPHFTYAHIIDNRIQGQQPKSTEPNLNEIDRPLDTRVLAASPIVQSRDLGVKATNDDSNETNGGSSSDARQISRGWSESAHVAANAYLNFTWPNKRISQADGDIMLGGLMMVHEREEQLVCGVVMDQGGVQAHEVMLYTLDYVNERSNILPGFKLGYYILDDCDKDTYGLEQSVDFIKGSISSLDDKEYKCADGSVPEGSQMKMISGVVGAPSSVTSIQVANLLRLFKIPQISFFSTSPELSNKERFEYFSRTVPSDEYQALAMIELIKLFNWSYISVIYEESNYGERAFTVIEEQLDKNHICIAVKEKLTKDSGVARENQYDVIVRKLLQKGSAKGVIIYGSDQEVGMLMAAVRRQRATGKFMWIGSDGWSARDIVTAGREPEVEGTVSVQPLANPVMGFQDHFLNLTVPKDGKRDPWLYEVWEKYFECRYPGTDKTYENQVVHPEWNDKICTGQESLRSLLPPKGNLKMDDQLQFVSDAVLAFAYAFRDMHKDLCHGKPGLCEEMNPPDGPTTLNYIRKVKFTGLTGDNFEFLPNGDGPPRYNIIHFKQVSKGVYKWVKVGKYVDKILKVNMDEIKYKWDQASPPESVCSKPCGRGQAKKIQGDNRCCWICVDCTPYQILVPMISHSATMSPVSTILTGGAPPGENLEGVNLTSSAKNENATINTLLQATNNVTQVKDILSESTQCVDCEMGFLPDTLYLNRCLPIPDVYMSYSNPLAIGALCFAFLGTLCTLFVLGVFIKYCQTPVVKASGRELSFALLIGILCCYGVTFLLVAKPSSAMLCGATFVCVGTFFALCYAAILTKTNRIARIFNSGKRTSKRPSLISPKSQICICGLLVVVQIAIMAVKLMMSPPKAIHNYPTRTTSQLVCSVTLDSSYIICLAYPFILILVCTVYAVMTRKIPEAFNESKYIGFTMYTTCIIWLAFVPIFIITVNNISLRILTICVSMSLSATTALCCLFTPKLYIILLHPEKNIRQTMMQGGTKFGGPAGGKRTMNNNDNNTMTGGGGTSSQMFSSNLATGVPGGPGVITSTSVQPPSSSTNFSPPSPRPSPTATATGLKVPSVGAAAAAIKSAATTTTDTTQKANQLTTTASTTPLLLPTTPLSAYSRVDSGTQSDDMELTDKLRPATSVTSCYSTSNKSSIATQTMFEDDDYRMHDEDSDLLENHGHHHDDDEEDEYVDFGDEQDDDVLGEMIGLNGQIERETSLDSTTNVETEDLRKRRGSNIFDRTEGSNKKSDTKRPSIQSSALAYLKGLAAVGSNNSGGTAASKRSSLGSITGLMGNNRASKKYPQIKKKSTSLSTGPVNAGLPSSRTSNDSHYQPQATPRKISNSIYKYGELKQGDVQL